MKLERFYTHATSLRSRKLKAGYLIVITGGHLGVKTYLFAGNGHYIFKILGKIKCKGQSISKIMHPFKCGRLHIYINM